MTLREILQQWLDDATSAEPSALVKRFGLCDYVDCAAPMYVRSEFAELLRSEFANNAVYPFGGFMVYSRDGRKGIQHTNPLRLAWVRKYLEETK